MSIATPEKTIPTMSVKNVTKALDRDHYVLTAYDSDERWNFKVVVVLPEINEPTWVLRPGTRKVTRQNVLALAVPSLEALTLDLAQAHTRMGTDYITVHTLPRENRRAGSLAKGERVRMGWER